MTVRNNGHAGPGRKARERRRRIVAIVVVVAMLAAIGLAAGATLVSDGARAEFGRPGSHTIIR